MRRRADWKRTARGWRLDGTGGAHAEVIGRSRYLWTVYQTFYFGMELDAMCGGIAETEEKAKERAEIALDMHMDDWSA